LLGLAQRARDKEAFANIMGGKTSQSGNEKRGKKSGGGEHSVKHTGYPHPTRDRRTP